MKRRRFWWWLIFIVGLELFYVIASRAFLNGSYLKELINTDPNDTWLDYKYAFSPFPGFVVLRNVEFRAQDSNMQLYFSLDETRVFIFLPSLFRKEVHFTSLSGNGLLFRLRLKRLPSEVHKAHFSALPPIPGLTHFLRDNIKPPRPLNPWKVRMQNIVVDNVRELWFEEYRFQGEAQARGGFYLKPSYEGHIFSGILSIKSGELSLGETRIADKLYGALRAQTRPFKREEVEGAALFKYLTASLQGEARIDNVRFLNYYLRKTPWLRFDGGEGHIATELRINDGQISSDSKLKLVSSKLEAHLFNQKARGEGFVSWHVEEKASRPLGVLHLRLGKYFVTHPKSENTRIEGNNLEVTIGTRDMQISDAFDDLQVHISLPNAQITDLRYFNAYLSPSSGVRFTGGRGRVDASLFATEGRTWNDTGKVKVRATNAKITYDRVAMNGNLEIDCILNEGSMQTKHFDVSGTTFKFTDVVSKLDGDSVTSGTWWGNALIKEGHLKIGDTLNIQGVVTADGMDARPILAIFEGLPGIVRNLLSFRGLMASAVISVSEKKDDYLECGNNRRELSN